MKGEASDPWFERKQVLETLANRKTMIEMPLGEFLRFVFSMRFITTDN